MNHIVGAIFPISAEHASRIFDEGRTVFVKYTNMNNFNKKPKIVFYITKEKKLIGEGVARNVEKMTSSDAWSRYGASLFLNSDEYEQYTSWSTVENKKRTTAKITVFILENLRKYKQNPSFRGITSVGRYIAIEDYNKIRG